MLYQYYAFQVIELTWISSSTTVNIFVYMHDSVISEKVMPRSPLTKMTLKSLNLSFVGVSGMKQAKECSVVY